MDPKSQWQVKFNSAPPKSPQTIKMVLDWYENSDEMRINRIIDRLEELSATQESPKKLPNNTKLIKTWRGKRYEVSVIGNGYSYDGVIYKSLSKIAKIITGTHQSGNIFFGVKNAKR